MKRVLLASTLAVVVAAGALPAGQRAHGAGVPRTSDGRPDLQGYWTTQTFTPLQRPDRYAGREFLSEAEAAELKQLLSQPNVDPLVGGVLAADDSKRDKAVEQNDPTHYDNAIWLQTARPKTLTSLRTSLIVEPADGKLPPLTADGARRAAARRANAGFDSYENRPLQERCVVWTHEGPPMMPPPYNDVLQILQTPGYVTFMREVTTNPPRIIPTAAPPAGRPHLPATIRQWGGDSRGRWEGDTLVVETTNYNDRLAFMGSSASLSLVERFTRTDSETIHYRFTVSDPETWTRPWTAELPMMKTEGPLHEYTCHEANYGLANILRGARVADAAKAKAGKE
jgi:hypothetical protein